MFSLCHFFPVCPTWISRAIKSLSFGYFSITSTPMGTTSSPCSDSFSCSAWQIQHDVGRVQSHGGFIFAAFAIQNFCFDSGWFINCALDLHLPRGPKRAGQASTSKLGENHGTPRKAQWKYSICALVCMTLCLSFHDLMRVWWFESGLD